MIILYVPFFIQGVLITVDEFLHQKRGLGSWERFGHPLDTLTVLIPLLYVATAPFTEQSLLVFIGLAAFSCLFITKDEFVHAKECDGFESWLHALLFIIHPVIFLSTALLWKNDSENIFFMGLPWVVALFMVYQILRWSIPWKKIAK